MSGIIQSLIGSFGAAAAAVTDAYFYLVTLLLNTTSTNGAQNNTFLDSSSNGFTITRNGNTTQGTFTPFSQTGWSNYFDGSSALTLGSSSDFILDANFTIEGFIYPTTSGTDRYICAYTDSSPVASWDCYLDTTNKLNFRWINTVPTAYTVTSVATIPSNSWTYFAVTLSGTTLTLYVNGSSVATTTVAGSARTGTRTFGIGQPGASTVSRFSGYISNIRYVKGTALTISSTPTSPLTPVTNTKVLTCQSNYFVDNSSVPFAETAVGTPSVQAFSPFAPASAYGVSTVGGSGYFDGSGDYLTVPNSTNYSLTGDYTIEAFVYPSVTGGNARIFMMGDYRSTFNGIDIYTNASNQVVFYSNGASIITGGTLNPFSWNHVALVRSGSGTNNTTLYLNGVSIGQATNTTSFAGVAGNGISIGLEYSGAGTSVTTACYLTNIRVVKGQALTSGAFTPPTAPVNTTSVGWTGANVVGSLTGTVQLLLSATNAGIYDAAAKNDLETVGNAQVSTTQAKFGTTSMYFDGTGDWLLSPSSPNYSFGTGDFTVEMWIYRNNNGCDLFFVGGAATGAFEFYINGLNQIRLSTYSGSTESVIATSTGTISATTWTHIAVTRNGTSVRLFINGTIDGTATNSTNFSLQTPVYIASNSSGTTALNGYLDEFRITKGYARYTANFTPPTSAFPVQ